MMGVNRPRTTRRPAKKKRRKAGPITAAGRRRWAQLQKKGWTLPGETMTRWWASGAGNR